MLESKDDDQFLAGLISDMSQKTNDIPISNLPGSDLDLFNELMANNNDDIVIDNTIYHRSSKLLEVNIGKTSGADDNSTINVCLSFENRITKIFITPLLYFRYGWLILSNLTHLFLF